MSLIAVVGVCASGKTTLVTNLKEAGFNAYNVAQEHSCIKKFWNKHHPDILIMIDASLAAIKKRRIVYWDESRLTAQHERLSDAKAHADLYIQTDSLSKEDVLKEVIAFIKKAEATV
jgi:deoxyadenosine/deoxycytidine kinase